MIIFRSRLHRYAALFFGFFLCCFFQSTILRAQNISGVINKYAQVLEVDTCMNELLISDATGFFPGDRVLLIQMKGASIDLSNTAAFGKITSYGNAGNYEFAQIASIKGLFVKLKNKIVRLYDTPKGAVQLVRIPQYTNVTVTDTVKALPWNGQRGGIVVMEVSGTVTLNSHIDVSGAGFKGGTRNIGAQYQDQTDYYASEFSDSSGKKGEGITAYSTGYESARGALANGGGGGNTENAGGGGGSNGGNGGTGGDQTSRFTRIPNGGVGGRNIDYTVAAKKIFFGGGGGGGQQNDVQGTDGGNGGGIVIIRADILSGGGRKIIVDGYTAKDALADGAGGGGAGGTIVLDVNTINNNPVLSMQGGKGGNNNADNQSKQDWCFAPGGGGSGGTVIVKGPSVPPSSLNGGAAGKITEPTLPCTGTTYGATDGEKGGGIWNNIITDGNVPFTFPTVTTPLETICEGETVQLNLPGAHGIKWSPGAGLDNDASGTPNASPSVTTHYTVSYLDDRNCAFLDTALVIVNPKPKPVIAGSINVCANQTFFYTITPVPGATYQWIVSGGTLLTGQGTESAGIQWGSGVSGTLEVDVTASGTSCFGKAIISIVINPIVSDSIIGAHPICEGETVTLSADTGFVSYLWSDGETTQSIKVSKAGDYFVKTISAGGCTIYSDTVTIIVHPIPIVTINASAPVMADTGGIDTLTLSGKFVSYKWTTGALTDTIFVTDSGSYGVSVIDANGCSASAVIHITRDIAPPKITVALDTLEGAPCDMIVLPLKIVTSENMPPSGATDYTLEITFDQSLLAPVNKNIQFVIKGRWRTLTLTGIRPDNQVAGILAGIELEVALGDTIATVITVKTFIFSNGKKVLVTKYDGLFKLTKLCHEGGTRLFAESDSLILRQNIPNPAQGATTITYSLLEEGNSKLWITDVLGRKVMTLFDDYMKAGGYSYRLNTSALPAGNYFYILQTPTSVKRRMMRIER